MILSKARRRGEKKQLSGFGFNPTYTIYAASTVWVYAQTLLWVMAKRIKLFDKNLTCFFLAVTLLWGVTEKWLAGQTRLRGGGHCGHPPGGTKMVWGCRKTGGVWPNSNTAQSGFQIWFEI